MRVIAGEYRHRKLIAPAGLATRPTSDRLRETLFNVMGKAVAGSVWIDLFAGSGAVGIEALSRGARQVFFVESVKTAAQVIRQNLQSIEIASGFELLQRDAVTALKILQERALACHFCFIDPPYESIAAYGLALDFLSQSTLLTSASTVIVEHEKHFDPGGDYGLLQRYRKLVQGDSVLSFYRRTAA